MIRFIELFAGIGGFRNGLEACNIKPTHIRKESKQEKRTLRGERTTTKQGLLLRPRDRTTSFRCVYANEWDKYAAQIYRRHYGEIDTRDIRDVSEFPDFDLLTAGFPCQAFSVAGKRLGFEDTRGTLFFEIARIAKHYQPMFLLLENVKGLASHNEGKTIDIILETLQELGYYTNHEVYNSKEYGVPQNRERIFFVCTHIKGLDGQNRKMVSSRKIITEWLFQNFLSDFKEVKRLQETISKDWIVAWLILKGIVNAFGKQKNLQSFGIISKDLLRKSKKDFQPSLLMPSTIRRESLEEKSITEVEELLIVLEDFNYASTENMWQSIDTFLLNILGENSKELNKCIISTAIKQIIDSKTYTYSQMFLAILLATVQLRKSSSLLWKETLSSLTVIQEGTKYARNNTRTEECVVTESGVAHIAKNLQDFSKSFIIGHSRNECSGQVFPVRQGNKGDTQPARQTEAENISGGITPKSHFPQYRFDNSTTLIELTEKLPVSQRIYDPGGIAKTLKSEAGGKGAKTGLYAMCGRENGQQLEPRGDETNSLTSVSKDNLWLENARIRRLTPVECERLQGFPDNYTEWGIVGGRKGLLKISDTQRYKCLGNAATTTVIKAIGKELLKHT